MTPVRRRRWIHRVAAVLAAVVVLIAARPAIADLKADELLLIVNANEPESFELAKFYAQVRNVPDGRIVALDLKMATELPRDAYDSSVRDPVRAYLTDNGLADQVRCLVTFYGVPLRVGAFEPTADESAELVAIETESVEALEALRPGMRRTLATAEAMGMTVPSGPLGSTLQKAVNQLALAQRMIAQKAQQMTPQEQQSIVAAIDEIRAIFAVTPAGFEPLSAEETEQFRRAMRDEQSADARQLARELARRSGPLDWAQTLAAQERRLSTEQTVAALDSELALLWRDDVAPSLWASNPLAGNLKGQIGQAKSLMVSRIDAPTLEDARRIIADSIETEAEGLTGSFAIDSRGLQLPARGEEQDGYSPFDQQLRQLARFARQAGNAFVRHDDKPEVVKRPGERPAASDVALYAGWYQLRRFENAFEFNRGAVGYHIASFELVELHKPGEPGWVAGLLKNGIAATVGPVAEPYLAAFPAPLAFFPLLMSGQLTLAETYWSTVPMTSWQMVLIGDPLYNPYQAAPAIEPARLPPQFQAILDSAQ